MRGFHGSFCLAKYEDIQPRHLSVSFWLYSRSSENGIIIEGSKTSFTCVFNRSSIGIHAHKLLAPPTVTLLRAPPPQQRGRLIYCIQNFPRC